MRKETKRSLGRFGIILGVAVFLRVILALIAPFEMQRYFGFGVMLVAIICFFVWDSQAKKKES